MDKLPKIGEKCHYYWVKGRDYRTGECVAHHDGKAIIVDDENYSYTGCFANNLRPFKSEAEKQQDKQIEAIHEVLAADGDWYSSPNKTVAEKLYKAGCHMTHKITADDINQLYRKHLVTDIAGTGYDFARAIEAHILGEN